MFKKMQGGIEIIGVLLVFIVVAFCILVLVPTEAQRIASGLTAVVTLLTGVARFMQTMRVET